MTIMGKNIGEHPTRALKVAVSSNQKYESVGLHKGKKVNIRCYTKALWAS